MSESVIDNLSVCTWDCRDGEEELPELKKSQTMESNVYCFETTKGGQKRPCCAKQETGQPLDFYVAIKAINQTDDKILQAIVLNNGTWELYETRRQVCQENNIKSIVACITKNIFLLNISTTVFLYKDTIIGKVCRIQSREGG